MHHAARREMRANEYSAMPRTGKPRSADRYFRLPCCALQLARRTKDAFSGGPARSAESTETTPIRALINWMSFAAARDRTPCSCRHAPTLEVARQVARRLPDAGCSASPANRRTCDRGVSAASRARFASTPGRAPVPAAANAMIAALSTADHAPSPTRHMHAPSPG